MAGTMDHLIAATLAVFAGSIVEGILGFGCSLVWMSFFPLFTTVPDAVGVLQPMHIALNIILLANIWRRCTPKELKPLLTTVPFGIVFGLWIVTSWSSNAIDCVLGVFLIVYTFLKNEDEDNADNNNKTYTDDDASSTSTGVKKLTKDLIKRKRSNLELEPLDEIDFGEEKKDEYNLKMPAAEEMPHPTLEMSPLTHRRHPIGVAETGEGGTDNSSIHIPNINYNSNNNSLSNSINNSINNNLDQHQHQNQYQNQSTPMATATATKANNNTKKNSADMLRNPTAICAGLVGGALMGAFGTGGPAFLIYAKEAGWQRRPELFRANLQLLFFLINVPVCLSQLAEGIITYERCKASCCLLPALIAGGHVGGILATKVPRDKFQILVVNGLRIMGLMFLIEATQ